MKEVKMRIKYLFCRTELGELRKTDNDTYVYDSNVFNEQELLRTSKEFEASDYSLWNSVNRESSMLFGDFKRLIKAFSNKPLIRDLANITGNESEWDRLVKFASLSYFTPAFYVQLADEERN